MNTYDPTNTARLLRCAKGARRFAKHVPGDVVTNREIEIAEALSACEVERARLEALSAAPPKYEPVGAPFDEPIPTDDFT